MPNPTINILNQGAFRLVSTLPNQDMFYGQAYGGAMDEEAASFAHAILKQKPTHKLIECSLKAIKLQFNQSLSIAITGADLKWKLNDELVAVGKEIKVSTGDILSGAYAVSGLRSYIAIDKAITSMSNKEIKLAKANKKIKSEPKSIYQLTISDEVKIHRGPEWNLLIQEGKEEMINYQGIISQDLDRMGAYILGPKIQLKKDFPKKSVCTFPGVIQLLPNGQLIVLLKDAQTTGGYPRIAFIDAKALNQFNQLAPGHKIEWRLML